MKYFKQITLAAISILSAGVMTSAMAVAPLPMGWYVDANVGTAKVTNASYASGSSFSNSGVGWNLNVGYKFTPFFAAEAGYTNYANSTSKVNGVKIATATYYTYDAAGKGILPIGDTGAELFAKLGIAHLNSNVKAENSSYATANGIAVSTGTSNVNGYYYALGAAYYFIPALAGNIQWQRAKGNSKTGNLALTSLGISYLFG